MAMGSAFTGKILDWEYQNFKTRMSRGTTEKDNRDAEGPDFPIEKVTRHLKLVSADGTSNSNLMSTQARLRLLPFFLLFYVACCIGYGWCVDRKVALAGPIILLVGSKV